MPLYAFFKCHLWCTAILRGASKSTFSKYDFDREGRRHKMSTPVPCYALDNVDNSGGRLS